MYNRLRNEAIDNERQTQREAFELLAKHIELMNEKDDRKRQRPLKTMTDAQEKKIKALVSEMGITINTVFQNFGKATFAGIGGLQTRYENLASAMRDILQGPYDTDDKEYAIKLTSGLIPKLRRLESLLRNTNAFTVSEKAIIQVIVNNIEAKAGNGFQPAFEPLGSFTEIMVTEPKPPAEPKAKIGRPSGAAVSKEDPEYLRVLEKVDNIIQKAVDKGDGDTEDAARDERKTLVAGGKKKKTIPGLTFEGVKNQLKVLARQLEPPTPGRLGRMAAYEEEPEEYMEEGAA